MQQPRSASALGADFPYTLQTMCYIEIGAAGDVKFGRDAGTYERARSGAVRLFAVWPGQWRSDLFAIDDLDEYARAFGLVHDPTRTGLADHEHDIRWSISAHEDKPNGTYISIELRLDCGCRILDLDAFAKQMREQRGWDIATTTGWGSSGSLDDVHRTYHLRARRKSLGVPTGSP